MASDPETLQVVYLRIEASSQRTFWQTVLGYEHERADRLEDPTGRDPAISFADRCEQNHLRGRIHGDVVRPADPVKAVMTTLGQEPFGACGLTIADVDGNEVDLVPGDVLSKDPGTSDWSVVFGAVVFCPTESSFHAISLVSAVPGMADEAKIPLLLGLRPVDVGAVREFWTSVPGYQKDTRPSVTDIYDPRRLNPVIIFQEMDPRDEDRRRERNRLHIELQVSAETARQKTEAVLAAGVGPLRGRRDSSAPSPIPKATKSPWSRRHRCGERPDRRPHRRFPAENTAPSEPTAPLVMEKGNVVHC